MLLLTKSLQAWDTPGFSNALKEEIRENAAQALPLQRALSRTSYALDDDIQVMIIAVSDEPGLVRVKAGVFYAGIVAGCSCADDPTPVEEQNEYCEMVFEIDKKTANTTVTLLAGTEPRQGA